MVAVDGSSDWWDPRRCRRGENLGIPTRTRGVRGSRRTRDGG
ncbi:hypothetical protein HMPREF9056_02496 [Actinomyces sp. oral taxon 170 str. F0386]|nr:hypothetical protein HMPREF9056_02496 [Actinomyces sp. oral taxon 170 str. F0386]